jgi:hypothetical protein
MRVVPLDPALPPFMGVLVGVNNGGSALDGYQFTFRVVKIEGDPRDNLPAMYIYQREIDTMQVLHYDESGAVRAPRTSETRRCEAYARKGTGYGTCDQPLSPSGGCLYASTHVEPV